MSMKKNVISPVLVPGANEYSDVPMEYLEQAVSFFKGRILTQLDATYGDPVQRKAAKDVFQNLLCDFIEMIRIKHIKA